MFARSFAKSAAAGTRERELLHLAQIAEDAPNVTDRKRVVPCILDQMQFAVRQSGRDLLRGRKRKAAILPPMPETDRAGNVFESKAPRRRINFRVRDHAVGWPAPPATRTFEAGVERGRILECGRVERWQKLKQEMPEAESGRDCGDGPGKVKDDP